MRITTFGIVFLIIFIVTGGLTALLRKWENVTEAIGVNGTRMPLLKVHRQLIRVAFLQKYYH